ncbi:hypothetical protein [Agrobacterium tumefaciens]|nr:hypothetical protein [Agrobacterium tumefaciens]
MAYDWTGAGREGKFDELAAGFIFFAIICLLLVSIYLLTALSN